MLGPDFWFSTSCLLFMLSVWQYGLNIYVLIATEVDDEASTEYSISVFFAMAKLY